MAAISTEHDVSVLDTGKWTTQHVFNHMVPMMYIILSLHTPYICQE